MLAHAKDSFRLGREPTADDAFHQPELQLHLARKSGALNLLPTFPSHRLEPFDPTLPPCSNTTRASISVSNSNYASRGYSPSRPRLTFSPLNHHMNILLSRKPATVGENPCHLFPLCRGAVAPWRTRYRTLVAAILAFCPAGSSTACPEWAPSPVGKGPTPPNYLGPSSSPCRTRSRICTDMPRYLFPQSGTRTSQTSPVNRQSSLRRASTSAGMCVLDALKSLTRQGSPLCPIIAQVRQRRRTQTRPLGFGGCHGTSRRGLLPQHNRFSPVLKRHSHDAAANPALYPCLLDS
ncbi:hypothetical protein B0I35DRAFT_15370 [Stachybotrys elegans]|uniref:Uncharacterized protein n=1 Tax=Stachybotrys elegans TaxID=80388 RepID=A0A8K0T3U0_9HYPO|nr:hypothetical protein B0I35DRAFT_15370 [Stachybotrys elegans]